MTVWIIVAGYCLVMAMLLWLNNRFWKQLYEDEHDLTSEMSDDIIPPGTDPPA